MLFLSFGLPEISVCLGPNQQNSLNMGKILSDPIDLALELARQILSGEC